MKKIWIVIIGLILALALMLCLVRALNSSGDKVDKNEKAPAATEETQDVSQDASQDNNSETENVSPSYNNDEADDTYVPEKVEDDDGDNVVSFDDEDEKDDSKGGKSGSGDNEKQEVEDDGVWTPVA